MKKIRRIGALALTVAISAAAFGLSGCSETENKTLLAKYTFENVSGATTVNDATGTSEKNKLHI